MASMISRFVHISLHTTQILLFNMHISSFIGEQSWVCRSVRAEKHDVKLGI